MGNMNVGVYDVDFRANSFQELLEITKKSHGEVGT
jgi:hypothetical protein